MPISRDMAIFVLTITTTTTTTTQPITLPLAHVHGVKIYELRYPNFKCLVYCCFHDWLASFYHTEMFLAAVFFLSTLYDVTIYISTSLSQGSIKLTSKQMEMLKVEKTGELLGHVKLFIFCICVCAYQRQTCV